ncbi:MAG TPA: Tn3 family transposase, partial [Ktedonobacteraceae bacterium]|nr:Tn3 family transposase [Ktedonobacteraceae bacterium]
QLNRASALSLVINAIAVWNTRYFERAQTALARQGVPVPEHVWQHLSTLQWAHIHLNGSYHFTDITLKEDFRPLRQYQGPRLLHSAMSSVSESADADTMPTPEEEEIFTPIQLSLLLEEESDL